MSTTHTSRALHLKCALLPGVFFKLPRQSQILYLLLVPFRQSDPWPQLLIHTPPIPLKSLELKWPGLPTPAQQLPVLRLLYSVVIQIIHRYMSPHNSKAWLMAVVVVELLEPP